MNEDMQKVDVEALRALYKSNPVAGDVLDHFAERERDRSVTLISWIIRVFDVSRADAVSICRSLEDCGCGKFVPGRRGKQSRFEWDVSLMEAGKAASGETEEVHEMGETDDEDDEAEDRVREHLFHLRPDLELRITLPVDFNAAEAERLGAFLKSLPIG